MWSMLYLREFYDNEAMTARLCRQLHCLCSEHELLVATAFEQSLGLDDDFYSYS